MKSEKIKIAWQLLGGAGGTERVSQKLFNYFSTHPKVEIFPIYTSNSNITNVPIITKASELTFDCDIFQVFSDGGFDNPPIKDFTKTKFKFKIVENDVYGGSNHSKYDYKIVPSKASYELTQKKNCSYIYNPLWISKSHTDNYRTEYPQLKDKFIFGRVSRPDVSIYTDTNLKAYKLIENSNNYFVYMSPREQAKIDAKKLGIKNILFLPPSNNEYDVVKFYTTINVLAHTNRLGESFGNTIAEASMFSKPSVSHVGFVESWPQAQSELLGEKAEQLYVSNRKNLVDDYSKIMLRLMNNKQFYTDCSVYLESFSKQFDVELVGEKWLEVYRKIKSQVD